MPKKREIPPKGELEEMYIHQNFSLPMMSKHFNASVSLLRKWMSHYGIVKSAEATRERQRQTCVERYGVPVPVQSKEIAAKMKATNLERYGASCAMNTPEAIKRSIALKRKRYGTANNYAKVVETNRRKYGVKAPLQNPEVMEKMKRTNVERYGAENVFASEEIKQKIKEVVEERYGVPYACMTKQCRDSMTKNESSANVAFENMLVDGSIQYSREFPLESYSFDFKVGDCLIEIDPSCTHNSLWGWRGHGEPLPRDYHKKKSEIARKHGFRCVHVFDWDEPKKVVAQLVGRKVMYARKCDICEVSKSEAKAFLLENHLQGSCNGISIAYGLRCGGRLVELMCFGKSRYNKNFDWELLRLCSLCGVSVVGGASRLFNRFLEEHPNQSVVSYCDLSKFDGKVYAELGFSHLRDNAPGRHWVHPYTKRHITQALLSSKGYDALFKQHYGKERSNEDLMIEHGFVPVYDCGQAVWTYGK